ERDVRGMVPVEIARSVLIKRNPRGALLDRRIYVSPVGFTLVVFGDAERCERSGELSISGRVALHELGAETPDAVGAEVALGGDCVAVDRMGFCKRRATESARFLS